MAAKNPNKKKRVRKHLLRNPPVVPVGRPAKPYDAATYPQMLIEHMRKGQAFYTFGAILDPMVSRTKVFEWLEEHEEFANAKRAGEAAAEIYLTSLLYGGAAGQLKRKSKRTVAKDTRGRVIRDKDGNPVMEDEFEPATFNATAIIFAMKNKFPKDWRDRKEIDLGNTPNRGPLRISTLEPDAAKDMLNKLGAVLTEAAHQGEDEETE